MAKFTLESSEYNDLMAELVDLRKLRDSIKVTYPTEAEIDGARKSVADGERWVTVPIRVYMDGRAAARSDAMQTILDKVKDRMGTMLAEFDHDYLEEITLYGECTMLQQSLYLREKKDGE